MYWVYERYARMKGERLRAASSAPTDAVALAARNGDGIEVLAGRFARELGGAGITVEASSSAMGGPAFGADVGRAPADCLRRFGPRSSSHARRNAPRPEPMQNQRSGRPGGDHRAFVCGPRGLVGATGARPLKARTRSRRSTPARQAGKREELAQPSADAQYVVGPPRPPSPESVPTTRLPAGQVVPRRLPPWEATWCQRSPSERELPCGARRIGRIARGG